MNVRFSGSMASAAILAMALAGCATSTPKSGPSFFVTSQGSGKGADFGGLAGADKHCQTLATAAGLGDRTWRAYLSDYLKETVRLGCGLDAGSQRERPDQHRAVAER